VGEKIGRGDIIDYDGSVRPQDWDEIQGKNETG